MVTVRDGMGGAALVIAPRFESPRSASSERIASSDFLANLAEVGLANLPLGIDQVLGRPVVVSDASRCRSRCPGRRDSDAESLDRSPMLRASRLELELRRVDADDDEPVLAVLLVPGLTCGRVRMQLMQV